MVFTGGLTILLKNECRKDCINYLCIYCICLQLKESKRAVNSIPLLDEDEDEDEVEKVSWSGEPVGSMQALFNRDILSTIIRGSFASVRKSP